MDHANGAIDRSWDTEIERVYSGPHGIITAHEFYAGFGNTSRLNRGDPIDMWFERRVCGLPGCNKAELKVDSNRFSYCPICHTVYNDGKPPAREKTDDQLIKASNIKQQDRKKKFKRLCRR